MIDALTRVWVLPLWTGPVEPKPMTGGLSNLSFFVEDAGRKYVVRFGRDYPFHHVFRARELMVARAAHRAGFGPEIVHTGPGVMVGSYVEAVTCSGAAVRANIGRVADILRRFHETMPRHISGAGFMYWPFHVIRDYARTLKAGEHRLADRLAGFVELGNEMERAQVPLPVVFGHNDLMPENILDDGERLWFIDYEYAGFTTPLSDLANLAGNADFSDAESRELLSAYFGAPPAPEISRSYDAMLCAATLREAMWGMVSELHIDMQDVDFESYTANNLARFDAALDRYRTRHGND
ncbi:MAG: choline/ethanolamine kinase family protein [Mesorhizobium sp.]|nr:choline/ethanolamine kinase family protein [Mesorhizobium sp.]